MPLGFRRKKGFIFKVIVAIPVLWFSFIGFVVVISQGGIPEQVHPRNVLSRQDAVESRRPNRETSPPKPPILEQPNPDRMRFEDAMKRDAEEERIRNQMRIKMMEEKFKMSDSKDLPTPPPEGPGELGRAVIIEKDKLSPEQRKIFDKGWQANAFNQYASDMISLHRSLPDVRDMECRTEDYPGPLPDTSVIVCFHNEAWSVLLRTVHSIIDRSPPEMLKEIILVDDFSDLPHLKTPLEDYIAKLGNVKVVRTKKREGLIRARLIGASAAVGEVLTYLDSHCECAKGWLEPLLYRIKLNWTNVATPVIDVLDDDTLRYQFSGAKSTSVGGFDWNLQFNWHAIPDRERKRRKRDIDPVQSPTMAGGLFSISKRYFEYLGTYDPGMDIWGGENLELSFRIWMCGGILEIIPCSHVGHIFRKRSPYSWKTGVNVVKKNSVRLAEVWMDEYKKYYYERFNFDLGEYGDITSRKDLRNRLQCKSFDWFVKNIYPELFIPGDAVASGEIRNKVKPMCLDSSVDHHAMNKAIKMWPCHNQGGNQYWMLSKDGEIRRDEGCMDYAGQFVMIYPCHSMKGNQEWLYGQDNTLRHRNTNLCMELSADGQKVDMKPCTGVDNQIWYWKRKTPDPHMG